MLSLAKLKEKAFFALADVQAEHEAKEKDLEEPVKDQPDYGQYLKDMEEAMGREAALLIEAKTRIHDLGPVWGDAMKNNAWLGGRPMDEVFGDQDYASMVENDIIYYARTAKNWDRPISLRLADMAVEAGIFGGSIDEFALKTMEQAMKMLAPLAFVGDWKIMGAYVVLKNLIEGEITKFQMQQGQDRPREDPDPYQVGAY